MNSSYAYFAGGCFWGVEYFFTKVDGVQKVLSGFMGGHIKEPTYQEVCYCETGHLEVVEVTYDSSIVSYETLAKLFFEIHNPEQINGQGPDIGSQYLSAVFVSNDTERKTIENLIKILEEKGLHVATKILPKQEFYVAEEYHQNYYQKNGKTPYCHKYKKRF
jgi:methionine-S-sulfoxide reductase